MEFDVDRDHAPIRAQAGTGAPRGERELPPLCAVTATATATYGGVFERRVLLNDLWLDGRHRATRSALRISDPGLLDRLRALPSGQRILAVITTDWTVPGVPRWLDDFEVERIEP